MTGLLLCHFLARFRGESTEIKDRDMSVFFAQPETRRAMLDIAIGGLQDVLANDYCIPDVVKSATNDYLTENLRETNNVLAFIEHHEEISDSGIGVWQDMDVAETYTRYRRWCEENGRKPRANNVFTKSFLTQRNHHYEIKPYKRKVTVTQWGNGSEETRRGKEFHLHTPIPTDEDFSDVPF